MRPSSRRAPWRRWAQPQPGETLATATGAVTKNGPLETFGSHLVYVDATYHPGVVYLLLSGQNAGNYTMELALLGGVYLGGPGTNIADVY